MATPARTAPGRSSRPRRDPVPLIPGDGEPAGRIRAPRTSATSPTGTFTRKIILQPVPRTLALISPPDAIGPSMADRPITGP